MRARSATVTFVRVQQGCITVGHEIQNGRKPAAILLNDPENYIRVYIYILYKYGARMTWARRGFTTTTRLYISTPS